MNEHGPMRGNPAGLGAIISRLAHKVEELSRNIERMKLAEYMALYDSPWRLMRMNFLAGLARGLGIAIGFSILGAVVLFVLSRSFVANLPIIGRFIAEIVMIVRDRMAP
jgi:hypothetical protein